MKKLFWNFARSASFDRPSDAALFLFRPPSVLQRTLQKGLPVLRRRRLRPVPAKKHRALLCRHARPRHVFQNALVAAKGQKLQRSIYRGRGVAQELKHPLCVKSLPGGKPRLIQGVENFRILTGSNSDTLSFLRNGGRRTLGIEYTVNKNSKAWEVESYPNWCKATKESDNALLIECDKNKAKTGRTGIVRLRKGQRIIPLIIEQSTEKESLKQRLFGK